MMGAPDPNPEIDRFSKRLIMTILMAAKIHGHNTGPNAEADVQLCADIADSIITKTPPPKMVKR